MNINLATILLLPFIFSQTSAKLRQRRQGFVFPTEGENCRTPSNQPGFCIPLSSCEPLSRSRDFNLLRNSICGYDRNLPRICCPSASPVRPFVEPTVATRPTPPEVVTPRSVVTPRPPVTSTPSRQKPAILPRECGNSSKPLPRIVGGQPADLGTWPWMAAIYYTRSGLTSGTECGGALVSDRHVITAAHCVTNNRGNTMSPSTFTVRVGEYILNDDNDGASPEDVPVVNIVSHEDFQRRVFKNDIAIMTLQRSVQFTEFIRPICLPYDEFSSGDLAGRSGYVAGWGTVAFEGEFSPQLSQIQVPIWRNDDCNRVYRAERVPITREYMCAGVSDGTRDSCQGDSGGPLMTPSENMKFYLVGIVSFGKRCATVGYPGVYTRVNNYLDWIAANLT